MQPINQDGAGLNLTRALESLDRKQAEQRILRNRVLTIIGNWQFKLHCIEEENIKSFSLFGDIITMFRDRVLDEVDKLDFDVPEIKFIRSNLRSVIMTMAKKAFRKRRAEKGENR